ncbi:iron transporter FeoA [Spirochaetia bacterium]|nr:iron transporter FeoA [Spirochaetia bacterium]
MPLSFAKRGVANSIKRIAGKEDTKTRLEKLGFTVGSGVTVVSELAGSLIVNVRDSRIAISRDMANKILI